MNFKRKESLEIELVCAWVFILKSLIIGLKAL